MGYQTLLFLLFSFAVILLYYVCGRKLQKYIIFLANIAFMIFQGPKYLPFVVVTLLASYFTGIFISKIYRSEEAALAEITVPVQKAPVKAAYKKKAKLVLNIALFITIGLLVLCKYSGFIVENINRVLSLVSLKNISMFNMVLPVGISFYTFMAIGYVLDVYWKRYDAEKNFIDYTCFLMYFPHIVQGPIDRYDEFHNQVKEGIKFDYDNIAEGFQLLLWGFFKKLVLADRMNIFVDSVYNNYESYTGPIWVLATVLYAIVLYADFSGCIDIVSGVSKMLGIKLRKNFFNPFFSKDIPEFWRRWHISLGEWFKDYLYLPVSTTSLVKKLKKHYKTKGNTYLMNLSSTIIPTIVVWAVTGLWHGSAWKFVAWGMYYAVLMSLGLIFKEPCAKLRKKLDINENALGWNFFLMVKTFALTCIGRVWFRAISLKVANQIFLRTFMTPNTNIFKWEVLTSFGLSSFDLIVGIFAIAILFVGDHLREHFNLSEKFAEETYVFKSLVIITSIIVILLFGKYGPGIDMSNFVYQQF